MRGMESMAHEDGPDDGHRNFSVSRRLNRIEVEAVANGKIPRNCHSCIHVN
jgi:FKBP12-rapamycin complex-associated protein